MLAVLTIGMKTPSGDAGASDLLMDGVGVQTLAERHLTRRLCRLRRCPSSC